METTAIYKATLKLIKEGKISFLSMAEIGYHARVSASAVETLFEDREQLISSLGSYTFGRLNQIIASSISTGGTFEQRYFNLSDGLIRHYRSNPDVIPFHDHFANFPFNVDEVKELESQTIELLTNFFSEYFRIGQSVSSSTVANLFHENIKIIARSGGRITKDEVDILTRLFLKALEGMIPLQRHPREAA